MYKPEFISLYKSLMEKAEPFAVIQVVNSLRPSSSKIGDHAIMLANGQLVGWVGGGCVQGIAVKEGLLSLTDKTPKMVLISPDGNYQQVSERKVYEMRCHSGGTCELYIYPVLAKPSLVIAGKSKISAALARLALGAGYQVVIAGENTGIELPAEAVVASSHSEVSTDKNTYVLIATQGVQDAETLEFYLGKEQKYLGFVASKAKFAKLKEELVSKGISAEKLDSVYSPAGIDINAKLPEEVAVSILAQIIEISRKPEQDVSIPQCSIDSKPANEQQEVAAQKKQMQSTHVGVEPSSSESSDFQDIYYTNPVCGIPVSKSGAKHVVEHEGEKVYFCCDGCYNKFKNQPSQYLPAAKES